jgi:hypothetical protein
MKYRLLRWAGYVIKAKVKRNEYRIFVTKLFKNGYLEEGTIEELLERKTSGSSLENRDYGRRASLSAKVGTNFVDKRRSLGR